MTGDKPNVVVFVLDSVRYDRTSMAGYERDTTPNLARIAAQSDGRSFETAIAHARYTLPSSASLLTGRHPGDHGVGFGSNSLDHDVPTVAEAFQSAGYTTAMVSNNYFVSEDTGLDRGFDSFDRIRYSPKGLIESVGVGSLAKWVANIREHSAGFEADKHRHSGAYLTSELVQQQLDSLAAAADPFFLYVHFNQPHRPYYPPLKWFDKYSDDFEMSRSEAGDFTMAVHNNLVEKVAEGCPFTDDEWATLNALYDAQIEYTDQFVGELYDELRTRFDDNIFVATADHGEHLGERGALGHKYVLDDALLRVPMVTSGLDVAETAEPVQHTDMMRTLLEAAGGDASVIDGLDLHTETREFAVSQDDARSLEPLYDVNPDFDPSKFYASADETLPGRTAVRTATHRYVRGTDGSSALFRIPEEATDISGERATIESELDDRLDGWLEDHDHVGAPGSGQSSLTDGTKSRLMNMGYLEEEL